MTLLFFAQKNSYTICCHFKHRLTTHRESLLDADKMSLCYGISGAKGHRTYTRALANVSPASGYVRFTPNGFFTDTTVWNNTAPTSSVFSVGTSVASNGNGSNIIAYLFADVEGFSKFGSYKGNGNLDGPFVYCGFKPKYIMIKNTTQGTHWSIHDTASNTYNVSAFKNIAVLMKLKMGPRLAERLIT